MPRPFIRYEHHGAQVYVRQDLQGKHRDHCLCYHCAEFRPGQPDNCPLAQALYELCVKNDMVTPVWECPVFRDDLQPIVVEPRNLYFLHNVQHDGENVTVRRGTKWADAKPGDPLVILSANAEEQSYSRSAEVVNVRVLRFDTIEPVLLENEHDVTCQTVDGLFSAMLAAYPDFDRTEVVTVLTYRML